MVKRGRIVAFFIVVLLLAATIGTTITGVTKDIKLGLDLQGGFEILYDVEPLNEDQEVNDQVLEATAESLSRRVNTLGISETNISIEDNGRIRVQLAGVEDQQTARELLSTTAELTLRSTDGKLFLDGSDLVEGSAQQSFDPNTNEPVVTLKVKSASEFYDVSEEVYNTPDDPSTPYPDDLLVIWLDYDEDTSFAEQYGSADPEYISAPSFRQNGPIRSNSIQISGDFTVESAQQLADILNAGSLPVNLEETYSNSVGAQFGEQAMNKTIIAGAIGVAAIFLFMIAYYRFPGVIASLTLSVYIYLILVVFEMMNGVLTLPGIAALILGVGMAVDANIITYERIKEELKSGKSLMSAYKAGNKRSLSTILDANITTLIAAAVLFIFGTSSVKGFATMLIVSILVSFITAVYGTRLFMSLWVKSRFLNKRPRWFGVKPEDIQNIEDGKEVNATFMKRSFDFVGKRKLFFTISIALVAAGILALSVFRLNLGIDFSNGSRVSILSDGDITASQVEETMESEFDVSPEQVVISGDNNEIAVARFDSELSKDKVAEIQSYYEEEFGNTPNISTVSPIVAKELAKNAALAVLYASIGIIIYVTIRFEIFFAITAIIALLHDAFFILAFFSLTRLEFDITIIAAILTIVGYSVNDTIVTFDRIRENLKLKKKVKSFSELAKIVNDSLMQTLARSFNTVITVIFAAVMLLVFGASSITNFSFALVIGLLAGTYSSLFIASQLWLVWRGRNIKDKPINYVKKKRNDGPQV
ncbi:protein translocase subunit SecDF [Halobacillus litoralis]|uniref:Multifunctional fusion protein n=1 Tax=Halobacillus litoralis TaxID=45668 RepID=A0A845E0U8_9BACI|nr:MULTISPECIES: protein translocase subunit SecDF [Halobacillus]MYL19887.1 protein translocase subunit SecDF [Halobacillus litoralis]MYL29033.1 protein translocase subunit SecDF [Halobacillus halophilus]